MALLTVPPRNVLLGAAAMLGAVAGYGFAFHGKSQRQPWEVTSPLPDHGAAATAVADIVSVADLRPGLFAVGTMTALLATTRPRAVWVPAGAFAATAVAVKVVGKPAFAHSLNDGLGYPSSHSSVLVSALVGFALCAKGSRLNPAAAGAAGLGAALPLFVWLGNYHRLSEVLAGAATGTAIGMLAAAAAGATEKSGTRSAPAPLRSATGTAVPGKTR